MYRFFLLIFFTVSFSNSFCQKKNELNIIGGYSQAGQSSDQFVTSYWRQNVHSAFIGLEYNYNITKKSAIGFGVEFVEKGFRQWYGKNLWGTPYFTSYFYSYNYLELPLYYRYTFKKWYFKVGAYGAYMVSSAQGALHTFDNGNGVLSENRGVNDNLINVRRFDVGMVLGFGYKITPRLKAFGTFTRGFIRPYKYDSQELIFNECFMFGFSYTFN
ncbi:MAG TPA: outer membrane beta-barrel protein [Bacteroidia bacterium]|jgi:hypothetical protein|nr:outer membrane beta-barrel protein [Bacteroidia bacterium]